MKSVFEDETVIRNLKSEILFDRLSHPDSSIEERLIKKELIRRGVIIDVFNPFSSPQDITTQNKPSIFANPLLDPSRFKLGVDLAEDDSPTELKIKVKRHNIKFNFNN